MIPIPALCIANFYHTNLNNLICIENKTFIDLHSKLETHTSIHKDITCCKPIAKKSTENTVLEAISTYFLQNVLLYFHAFKNIA